MNSVQKKSYRQGSIVTVMTLLLFIFFADAKLFAQCGIAAPSQTACAGTITFNASSAGSSVTNHTWYQSDGVTPVSSGVVTQVGIDYDNNGVRDAWTSKYVVSLSNNATFYVKPNCTIAALQVTYTLDPGSNVNIAINPANAIPDNLCAGESITLSTTGNSPEWRFNNPTDASYTGGASRVATQTGTYYLKAWNSCNALQERSIYLEFKPVMSGIAIAPGSETMCEGTIQTQYSAQGYNYQFLTWSITDDDPAVNATINSSTGLVTWNGMKGNATVSMTATGCHSTTVTPTAKSVYVRPKPTLTQCALSAGTASDIFACSAPQLSVQSVSSYVTSHKWYTTQNGSAEVAIEQAASPYGGAWVSKKVGPFTSNVTYWAEPQCDCGMVGTRVPVKFTLDPGSTIGLQMTPASNPNDLCAGESIKLSGTGSTPPSGASYEWRFNDQNKATPDWTGTDIFPTQSGTYYLRGVNSCGEWKGPASITLNFKPNISLTTPVTTQPNFCFGTQPTTQFTADVYNGTAVWQVSGAGNSISSTGLVTWGPTFGATANQTATITITANGCHGTQQSRQATITVYAPPGSTTTPASAAGIPVGSDYVALTGNQPGMTYQWFFEDQPIAGSTAIALQAKTPGSYKLKTTNSNSCSSVSAPIAVTFDNNYNYIIENTFTSDKKSDNTPIVEADIFSVTKNQRIQKWDYFDGLGRPMQSVSTNGSPLGFDLVTPLQYDQYGREAKKYLPFLSAQTNGWYKLDALTTQAGFYANGTTDKVIDDPMPYAVSQFEPSPLNRILKQGNFGTAWQPLNGDPMEMNDHTIKRRYEVNAASEVLQFSYEATAGTVYFSTGATPAYYSAGQLTANKTYGEDLNNEVIEYTDKEGRMVCKKVQYKTVGSEKKYASTYYIYDDKGRLAIVLPPEAVREILK